MHKDQNNSKYTDAFWGIGFGAFYGSNPIISNQWGHHLDLPISHSLKRPFSIATSNLKMDENGITISCWSCSCNTHTQIPLKMRGTRQLQRALDLPGVALPDQLQTAKEHRVACDDLWRSVTICDDLWRWDRPRLPWNSQLTGLI